jgi:hypothetical protein
MQTGLLQNTRSINQDITSIEEGIFRVISRLDLYFPFASLVVPPRTQDTMVQFSKLCKIMLRDRILEIREDFL